MAALRAPELVCDGQPMIRESVGGEAMEEEEEDVQYVYDLYTAADDDADDETGSGLPMVRKLPLQSYGTGEPVSIGQLFVPHNFFLWTPAGADY